MTYVPTKITFHGLDRSPTVEARIEDWISKLARVSHDLSRCDVVVESPHRHHRHGRRFHVRIVLERPGGTVVVDHDRGSDQAHEDVQVAVRDAFLAARRKLLIREALAADPMWG
jgi:hypothetical protein